jgi:hypothetical protein
MLPFDRTPTAGHACRSVGCRAARPNENESESELAISPSRRRPHRRGVVIRSTIRYRCDDPKSHGYSPVAIPSARYVICAPQGRVPMFKQPGAFKAWRILFSTKSRPPDQRAVSGSSLRPMVEPAHSDFVRPVSLAPLPVPAGESPSRRSLAVLSSRPAGTTAKPIRASRESTG